MLYGLLYAIFYPVYGLIRIFINVIIYIWSTIAGLFNSFIALFNSVYDYFVGLLTLIFPAAWVSLLMLGFLIVVALRLYSFAKDISIFGFKI